MATKTERWVCALIGAGLNIWAGHQKAKENNEEYTGEKILGRGLLGAGGGLIVAEVFGEPNDTVNYSLHHKRKRVYEGIAYEDRLDMRITEHRNSGKVFSNCVFDDAKPRSEAIDLERKKITRFRPKYNVQHNC